MGKVGVSFGPLVKFCNYLECSNYRLQTVKHKTCFLQLPVLTRSGLVCVSACSLLFTMVKSNLDELLGGPCYHGIVPIVEQVDHQEVWREAFDTGKIDPVLKRGVLNGFRAGLDHPFFCWYF